MAKAKLLDDIVMENRQLLEELYESFNNRNAAEIKQTGQTAVNNSVDFLAGYAAETQYDGMGALEVLRLAGAERLDANQTESVLVLLISRIERYERDFSGFHETLPGRLQLSDEFTDPIYMPIFSKNDSAELGVPDLRLGLLRMAWREALALVLTIAATEQFGRIDSRLLTISHYYFLFRAIREQVSSLSTSAPLARKAEESERLFRALLFAQSAVKIDDEVEARLTRAVILRNLGCESGQSVHLDGAASDYLWCLHGVLASAEPATSDCELTMRALRDAGYISRILNDTARLVETYGILMHRYGTAFDGVLPIDPTHKRALNHRLRATHGVRESEAVAEWSDISTRMQDLARLARNHGCSPTRRTTCERSLKKILGGLERLASAYGEGDWVERLRRIPDEVMSADVEGEGPQRAGAMRMWTAAERIFGLVGPQTTLGDMLPAESMPRDSAGLPTARGYVNRHNQARVLARLGRSHAAITAYKEVLRVRPDFAPAHENLAMTLIDLGEYAIAERHFSEARRLYAENSNRRTEFLDVNLGEVVVAERARKLELNRYLTQKSCIGDADELFILKRWNSYTPSLPSKPRSLGGGYFMILDGLGIVVDPGYDFIYNLGRAGFSVSDIDMIAITHLHMDHMEDLENLLLLLFERQKRTGHLERRVTLLVSDDLKARIKGRLDRLAADATFWDFLDYEVPSDSLGPATVRFGKSKRERVRVRTTTCHHVRKPAAEHDELCNGFVFEITQSHDHGTDLYRIGFTGDTRWVSTLVQDFAECDLIVAHLGEVYATDVDASGYIRSPLNPAIDSGGKRNHLGLSGVYHLFAPLDGVVVEADTKSRLLLLGEFGEEVGSHRIQIAEKLSRAFYKRSMNVRCLAADVGLRVRIGRTQSDGNARGKSIRIHCPYCGASAWRPYQEMRELIVESIGADSEAIHYYCNRHHPAHVIQREARWETTQAPA